MEVSFASNAHNCMTTKQQRVRFTDWKIIFSLPTLVQVIDLRECNKHQHVSAPHKDRFTLRPYLFTVSSKMVKLAKFGKTESNDDNPGTSEFELISSPQSEYLDKWVAAAEFVPGQPWKGSGGWSQTYIVSNG